MDDIKHRAIRGGVAKTVSQAANFGVRIGSLMILGRVLDPTDFGLVGMVMAVIGVLNLLKDFGLSSATIQRASVSDEEMSTLFWINSLVGVGLALAAAGSAPILAAFFHEPRLVGVTLVLSLSFLFNGAGIQHCALLQRELRFTTIAWIEISALILSTAAAIGMALLGYGYWALVATTVVLPLAGTVAAWGTTRWVPGLPRQVAFMGELMRFGGTITLNGIIMYVAYNLEKVLLGRFWGAEAVGVYGRAYQLVNIPTENLNSSVGGVAFSALSRLQDDPRRMASYFLKGYGALLALTIPATFACALFSHELIAVVLGPKWTEAAPIFRLLAPTILVFTLINPLAWFLFSMGMVGRSLKMAMVIAPLVITSYVLGLPYGPTGVAFAYSAAMSLWVVPHLLWFVRGTVISFMDMVHTICRPLLSGAVAALAAYALQTAVGQQWPPILKLAVGGTVLVSVHLLMLVYVMGQRDVYLGLLRSMVKSKATEEEALQSA
jgi:PST family polysaccharide transporter